MATIVLGGRTKKVKVKATKIKKGFFETIKDFFKKRIK